MRDLRFTIVTPSQKLTVNGVPNLGLVTPYLYRFGQPTSAGIVQLAKLGITDIRDFRAEDNDTAHNEMVQCDAYNIIWDRIPVPNFTLKFTIPPWQTPPPTDEQEAEWLAMISIAKTKGRKLGGHCLYGHDRTGAFMASFRIKMMGWGFDDTLKEMIAFGFDPKKHVEILKWVKEHLIG